MTVMALVVFGLKTVPGNASNLLVEPAFLYNNIALPPYLRCVEDRFPAALYAYAIDWER
jgi:hypothetical protein